MKPSWANLEIYKHFDSFLETTVLKSNSYITSSKGLFTTKHLDSCVTAFVDNPDEGDRDFDAKSRDQFSKYTAEVKEVFAHFIWLWAMPTSDMRMSGKKSAIIRFLGEDYNEQLTDVFPDGGIGSAGQRHKLNKPFEISYLLLLFRDVRRKVESNELKDVAGIKKQIELLCKELYYNNQNTNATDDNQLKEAGRSYLAMHHILLHLCNPDKYEAIAAQKHKDAIINTFFSLLDKEDTDGLWDDIDESIFAIRKKLSEIFGYEVSFYDEDIQDAWNFGDNKDDISEVTLFEYKKAIIFYGPPGTSKTYSANRLAELLISKQYFRNKQNIKEYFKNSDKIFEEHIHHLQLHSNYSYEDFVAGIQIEDRRTIVKPGYLLNLIDKIKNDKLPHILILDEINRTDVARLFGELFSALEYRTKEIRLSIGDLKIAVPSNLYFIGTMNEIDFSLERIDFALRRRFLWQFKGFDRSILYQMLLQKRKALGVNISDADIDTFIYRCEELNSLVSSMPELGDNYQVGHTFFAEIVDIFKSMKGVHSSRIYFLKQPTSILWEISIKPILQAFLGNMDSDSKKERIAELKKAFTNE